MATLKLVYCALSSVRAVAQIAWLNKVMECTTADALLNDYADAMLQYHEAVEMVFTFMGLDDQFEQARLRVRQRYATYKAAAVALQSHLDHHNCRVAARSKNRGTSDQLPH